MRKFMKFMKNSIIGKILKILLKLLIWAIELLIIALAAVILTQRLTNNENSFLGYRIFTVATGSMEPEYVVGNILISKEQDPETIHVGDNIVYLGRVGDYKGKIITHKVVRKEQDEKGDYLFYTKGIANTIEDPVVHEDMLYGTVVNNNIFLAFFCRILTNKYGLFFGVVIPITIYIFVGFVRVQGERIEQEREEERQRREERKKKREHVLAQKQKARELEEQNEENVESDLAEDVIEEQDVDTKNKTKKTKESEPIVEKKTRTKKTKEE